MWTGKMKAAGLAIMLALTAPALASCGSGGGQTTVAQPPSISPSTAGQLAKLSDRVATDLDSGDTCHAAHAADDLQTAVEEADIPPSMRPDVDAVTSSLVDQVNCPPPPPPPEPKKKPEPKPQGEQHGNDHQGDEHFVPPGHAKHGGFGPPGHAKLKGEPE
jgi:hypothetical protein